MPCDGTITIAADCDFSLANLPYGVFRLINDALIELLNQEEQHEQHRTTNRIGVALGNRLVDLSALHGRGVFADAPIVQSSECFLQVHTIFPPLRLPRRPGKIAS